MGAALETLIFLCAALLVAFLIWRDRAAAGIRPFSRLVRTLAIVLLPAFAFGSAYLNQRGDRLTLSVAQLRVPLSAVRAEASDGTFRDYLIVGDRPESADLVVAPYADQRLSQVSLPAAARSFVVVEARTGKATGAGKPEMAVRLRLRSFAPDAGLELPGMEVSLGGRPVPAAQAVRSELRPGQSVPITLSRIDVDGGRAERREFTVALTGGPDPAVDLSLNSPLFADGGSCEAPRLRLAPMPTFGAGQDQFRDPENLVFSGLGAGGTRPVLEARWLGPMAADAFLCAKGERHFSWPAAVESADARLRAVSQRISLPWYCCIFVLVCGLATHALCSGGWRGPTPERVVVPLVQWLLSLRVIIGVAGLYDDSRLRPWEVMWDGLAAFLCLPVLAVVALRPGGAALKPLMAALAVLVAGGYVAMWPGLGAGEALAIPALLCYVTFIACLVRIWFADAGAPLSLAGSKLALLFRQGDPPAVASGDGARAVSRFGSLVGGLHLRWQGLPPAFKAGMALALILIGWRLALIGIGRIGGPKLTERALGLPLSLVYVPGMILAVAALLQAARDMRPALAASSIALLVILAFVIVPVLAHDSGILLVSGIPIAAVAAWCGIREIAPRRRGRLLWISPLLLPLMLITAFGVSIATTSVPDPREDLGGYIAAVPGWDRNDVRMLGYLRPGDVETLGTKYAFEAMDQQTSLEPLTRDVLGHGFLSPSGVERPVLDYQYSDNLPAIHLMWPYGRVGMAALLLVVLAGVAALKPLSEHRLSGWPYHASLLAGATFAWAWIYMVMANLNWVPFTGRNLYLLAATSGGDLAEGLALLLIMSLCAVLHGRRSEAGREGQ